MFFWFKFYDILEWLFPKRIFKMNANYMSLILIKDYIYLNYICLKNVKFGQEYAWQACLLGGNTWGLVFMQCNLLVEWKTNIFLSKLSMQTLILFIHPFTFQIHIFSHIVPLIKLLLKIIIVYFIATYLLNQMPSPIYY